MLYMRERLVIGNTFYTGMLLVLIQTQVCSLYLLLVGGGGGRGDTPYDGLYRRLHLKGYRGKCHLGI